MIFKTFKFLHLQIMLFTILITFSGRELVFAQNEIITLYGKTLKEIRIEGAHFTHEDIIIRELASKVGQPYTKANAAKDYARLDKLDIFSFIRVQPVMEKDEVILNIKVKEIFPYLPFFSYEVTDENGFAGGPGFQSVNFLGQDRFFIASVRLGGATNINLFYEDPWISGNHLSVTFEFFQGDRFNKLDQFNEIASESMLRIGSYLGEYGRIGGRFSFISIKSDSAGRTLSSSNRDNIPTLGFFIGYDSRDLWSNPHRGWQNEFEISKSAGFLGGDGDFWSFNFDIRKYVPIIKRHTLALFSLTTLRIGDVGTDIPLHQDFHMGGTNSVRGWDISSERSGRNQWIGTAEYRVTVLEPKVLSVFGLTADIGLQVALFGDLGIVWNDKDQFDADNFIGGYGFGLRFLVPFVNMFRFDFGFGEPGESFRIHIGAFEKPVAQRFRVR
ncbi:MAG: BamA/TamA family outer membrane protein [bacterium]